MKKIFLRDVFMPVFLLSLGCFAFAQEITVFDGQAKEKHDYSQLMKKYLAEKNAEYCAEYLLKSKDFYSPENFNLSFPDTCAYQVTEAVLFRNYYSQQIENKEMVRAVEEHSMVFLTKFMPSLKKIMKIDETKSIKNKKYVALSKVYGLYEKYENSTIEEEDFALLFSKPEVLYVVFNNEKILKSPFVKDCFLAWDLYYQLGYPVGDDDLAMDDICNHSHYVIFPDAVFSAYSRLGEEKIDSFVFAYYRFSAMLNALVEISNQKKIPLERFFLKEEMQVVNSILEDSFNVFMLDVQCVLYFAERFNSIVLIEGQAEK